MVKKSSSKKVPTRKNLAIGIIVLILIIIGIVLYVSLQPGYVTLQPTKSTTCLSEGKGIPGGISSEAAAKYPSKCCKGLSFVSNSNLYDKNCNKLKGLDMPIGGPIQVCTKCGDGKCGTGETKCNCPKDCK